MADFDLAMAVDLETGQAVADTDKLAGALGRLDSGARKAAGGAQTLETASDGVSKSVVSLVGIEQRLDQVISSIQQSTVGAARGHAALRDAIQAQASAAAGLVTATNQAASAQAGAATAANAHSAAEARVAKAVADAERAASAAAIAAARLAETQGAAGTGAANLARAQAAAAKAALDEAAAEQRLAAATSDASRAAAAAELAQIRLTRIQKQGAAGLKEVEEGSARAAFGLRNAGQQVGDFGLSIAAGISPAQAFAQQAGQMGFALSEMGGAAGKVGAFLTGPWGIALTIAAAVAAPFITKLFEGEEAADKFAASLNTLAGATAALDEATGRANRTQAESITLARQATEERLKEAISLRKLLAARIADAEQQNSIRIRSPESVIANAGVLSAATARRDQNEQAIATAEAALRGGDFVGIRSRVAAATDKAAAANRRYEETETRLRRAFEAGTLDRRVAEVELLKAARARDAVTKATNAGTRGEGAAASARARLAAATTPLARAEAELALVRAQAPAKLTAGSAASAAYEARLTAAQAKVNGLRDATKAAGIATREAARDQREFEQSLDRVVKRFAPAVNAAREYSEALATLDRASADRVAGKAVPLTYVEELTARTGIEDAQRADRAKADAEALKRAYEATNVGETFEQSGEEFRRSVDAAADRLREGARDARHELTDGLDQLASILGDLFPGGAGGTVGRTINAGKSLFDLVGKRDGNIAKLQESLTKIAGPKGIGLNADAASKFGEIGGKAIQGAAEGALTNSVFEPIAKGLGLKTSKTGAQIGGAIGSATGVPGGAQIGAILGSITGGLFKKTPQGKVTLTSATGDLAATGNSAGAKAAAVSLGNSIQGGLQQIAEQLGGGLGSFNVTVGQRHGDFRVTTGSSLKVKKGAKDFNDDADAANAYAIGVALTQGAITGLSAAVSKALQSSTDVSKALTTALQVKDLEAFIATAADAAKEQFAAFDRAAAARVQLAKEYGVDLIAVEAANAKARTKLIDDTLRSSVGGLQDLLRDLGSGDLFEGSAVDKRRAIIGQIGSARADVANQVAGAGDTLAQLYRNLLETTREDFGTAGPEYASDRAMTQADAAGVIAAERERIAKAAEQQTASVTAAQATAAGVEETNNLLAIQNAGQANILAAIQQLAASGKGGGGGPFVGRSVSL